MRKRDYAVIHIMELRLSIYLYLYMYLYYTHTDARAHSTRATNDDGIQTPLVCVIELRLTSFMLAVASHRSYRVSAAWATGETHHRL